MKVIPNGLIIAELSNWTGKAFKIPRIKVKEYAAREELKGPGLYLLLGKNERNAEAIYIGEGEPVIDRILEHVSKRDFWNEAIVFVSKDKYLNKASIKYLENRVYEISIRADRYDILNANIPTQSGVSEAEQAELEEFLANVKLLTATLGHRVFEELKETIDQENNLPSEFFCRNSGGVLASGSPSTEGFVVFRNSIFANVTHPSLTESIRNERTKLITDKLLIQNGEFLTLTKDYTFNSSSRAAAMALGRSASGPLEWKTSQGVQLKHYEQ